MTWTIVILSAALLLLLYFRRRHLWRELRSEAGEAWREARAEQDAGPDADTAAMVGAYRALARPALILRPEPGSNEIEAGARLGGLTWLADGEEWPLDASGQRLEFVAQYDLARLPRLEGLPAAGVARFFVGRDDLWGANFDDPCASGAGVLWHEGPQVGGRLEEPAPLATEDYSPFMDNKVRTEGLALHPEPADDLPDYYSWQLQAALDPYAGGPGCQPLEDEIFEMSQQRGFAHKIGGHPTFTQYDFREEGKCEELDVLLLGLTSDDSIMWGDVGEASFLISRADLERRDFSRVAFYWDCH